MHETVQDEAGLDTVPQASKEPVEQEKMVVLGMAPQASKRSVEQETDVDTDCKLLAETAVEDKEHMAMYRQEDLWEELADH